MNEIKKRFEFSLALPSLVMIVLGLFLAIFSNTSTSIICMVIAMAILLYGVVEIISYFRNKPYNINNYSLVIGIVLTIIGLIFLLKTDLLASLLVIVCGVILLLAALKKVQYGFDMKKIGLSKWWVELIMAVVLIIVGLVVLFNPFETAVTIMQFIGIALTINGIWDLITIFVISKN